MCVCIATCNCRAGSGRPGTNGTSTIPVLPSTSQGLTPPPHGTTPLIGQAGTRSECKLGTMLDHQQQFMKSQSMVSPLPTYHLMIIIMSGYMNSLWLDIIQSLLIKPPIQASGNGSVPTGISLVFRANKTTQYGTDIVESVTYQWSFGDGSQTERTSEPIISHVFYAPGNYDITLLVLAAYSPTTPVTYRITVYESKAPPITPPIILL